MKLSYFALCSLFLTSVLSFHEIQKIHEEVPAINRERNIEYTKKRTKKL